MCFYKSFCSVSHLSSTVRAHQLFLSLYTNFGDRAFTAAGSRVWNCLLTDLKHAIQPLQTVAEHVFIRSVGPKRSENPICLRFRNTFSFYIPTYCGTNKWWWWWCRIKSTIFGRMSDAVVGREYCQFDTFNVSCSTDGEVLLVDSAYYGRLSLGHCVTRDYGFVGCFVDVLNVVAGRCSGRRECVLPVPQLRQLVRQPCPDDLTTYLDAEYRCVPGRKTCRYHSFMCIK